MSILWSLLKNCKDALNFCKLLNLGTQLIYWHKDPDTHSPMILQTSWDTVQSSCGDTRAKLVISQLSDLWRDYWAVFTRSPSTQQRAVSDGLHLTASSILDSCKPYQVIKAFACMGWLGIKYFTPGLIFFHGWMQDLMSDLWRDYWAAFTRSPSTQQLSQWRTSPRSKLYSRYL